MATNGTADLSIDLKTRCVVCNKDMVTKISGKRIVFPDGVREGEIYIENGKIASVGEKMPYDDEISVTDGYVLPGFIDIHTHGAVDHDFVSSSPDQIIEAVAYHALHGTTSIMPTISSYGYETTYRALENLEVAMKDEKYGRAIIGAHLEGPYFSLKQSGAQDPANITEPKREDYTRLVERFGSIIKRWDFAPERDNDGEFCSYLTEHGIIAAAGHTDAKYSDMCLSREKGLKLITHLYSCTSTITREQGFRVLGVTECAYLWDDIYAELIADGRHLPHELLSLIFKLKRHDRLILITDSLMAAGSEKDRGVMGNIEYIIEDGVCKLPDRSAFAGSIATTNRLLRVAIDAGLELSDAVKMLGENPAGLFGLNTGAIASGRDADLLICDGNLNIEKVILKGEEI